ncbi:hypothetical protein TBS_36650 [Thermobispora bispora]|jgi:uncharacterized protein YqgV (UPF0045/DUF77 family)|uniref:Thiamine-binding protein domain-containing protein n=1 Tax=Thermobispora bispora (strain ATCC 19993 / DSM 43833 / CBS 139.67 / JCM 10125 / KCTC 9307 / NBRC 14880 / R51) TaxID=469371 RepID=D6Y5A1_THEBD|nr:thiamine-binding protein [Thermobispora bispora]MBO2473624.1 hypothetical protein [Actinomycetales bacterium]MDI9581252.1 thiamine-binding protein [Thermobispora sp.]ADG89296.1 hypothetical protein Tbis_2594 [Thermobispora bispora DSM 43833]MBX6168842.1 thiamine-binding protein [Thermobispora bispora]QSI48965.1 hypothetical protein CYL17_14770 [Thermobispora bispora]
MRLIAEFTTEPFVGEGTPPAHATSAFEAARASGLTCEFGPLGTMVQGEADRVLSVLNSVLAAAFANGATRVTVQVERETDG